MGVINDNVLKQYANDIGLLNEYKKLGTIEQIKNKVYEEDVLKFYYCESKDEYFVGKRVDTLYYATVCPKTFCKTFRMSRYLPWGQHIVSEHTAWKEWTYPSEPKEIDFSEWLKGWINKNYEELIK